jgi:hypothetical protein
MSSQFQHQAADNNEANLYPNGPNSGGPQVGVCLSGGGSRALGCALGQLSALNAIVDPKTGKPILQEVYLSSVSGGSWASVLYSFLPTSISDSAFLIQPLAPSALFIGNPPDPTNPASGNVAYMGTSCLGLVPQRFSLTNIAAFLYTLYKWGFFDDMQKWSWFWIAGVGELVLAPFQLYSALYNQSNSYPEPSMYFSLSASHIASAITQNNHGLTPDLFYVCQSNRPPLIVNTNLLQTYTQQSSAQIPVQITPIAGIVAGQSPDGKIVGGGGVESFAFTSTLVGAGTAQPTAEVNFLRRYSLCDIAGCSSAFFAEFLLQYLNLEIDKIIDELECYLENKLKFPAWLAQSIGNDVKAHAQAFLDTDASHVIPQYNYWSLGEVGQNNPANINTGFSDGGDFDNTGILGMLAQTNVNAIVAFVNSEVPLSTDQASGQLLLDPSVALLFGYPGTLVNGKYVSFGGMNPNTPMSYVQVFSDGNGEFAALRQGLYNASCSGSVLGTAPAVFLQTLTTVSNPVANIASGRKVQVLWVYNNRVNNWQDAITGQLSLVLQQGQGAQPSGALANFPNYFTGEQIYLAPEAVNMLAQLSAWNVQQLQSQILSLL